MVHRLDDVFWWIYLPASVTILFYLTFVRLTKRGVFYSRKIRVIAVPADNYLAVYNLFTNL